MAVAYNPRIITNGLVLALDAGNSKSYDSRENLVSYSTYNAATWSNIFPAGATITTGIDAPNGSNTAVRFSCNNTTNALLRVSFPSFTPNGTDTYITSFYVRKISGTGNAFTDLADGAPSTNYSGQLVTDQWVRIVTSGVPTATAKTFIDLFSDQNTNYVLDFWGVQVEKNPSVTTYAETNGSIIARSTTWNDIIGSNNFTLTNSSYYSYDITTNTIKFARNLPPTAEDGGYATFTASGGLTAANYLHNDHTTEVWFKSNDRNPTSYDATEGISSVVVYRGYHSMWFYSSTTYQYGIWGRTSGVDNYYGLSFNDTSVNVWTQLVAIRSGNSLTLYKNGVLQNSGTITSGTDGIPTTNDIRIAAANYNASYAWHANIDFGSLRMYKRALTPSEIQQNYLATKLKYGL